MFSVGMKTQPESKCPELLANYCDMLLRKTPLSKKLTSEEIEFKLKEVVSFSPCSSHQTKYLFLFPHKIIFLQLLVLKYVQNKDVFMRYHKAHLTRRLILDISADSEIEENMVEWLRVRLYVKSGWALIGPVYKHDLLARFVWEIAIVVDPKFKKINVWVCVLLHICRKLGCPLTTSISWPECFRTLRSQRT